MGEKKGLRLAFVKRRFSIYGGAEQYLQTLITHLKKATHEIHIFANQWKEEEGVIFHKVNILPLGSFLATVSFNTYLKKTMTRDFKADCIISFERTTYQDIYRAGEGCHAEWLSLRSYIEPLYKKVSFTLSPFHRYLLHIERKIFSDTKLIIANSNMIKKQIMQRYKIPEERIEVLYNGVDLNRFTPLNRDRWRNRLRESIPISGDTKLLLFVGSGFRRKGLNILIDSIAHIKDKDVKLLVIGKDKDYKSYKILAKKRRVSQKIIFLGPQREIEKFYAASDLFVLPTLYDPFSNATLEAMASGLPVITTRNNGAAELIENGKEGFILNTSFNPKVLAENIINILSDLKGMGIMSRKKAEIFPIEQTVNKFEALINKISNA